MQNLNIPNEINVKSIFNNKLSLSSTNYKTISIKRKKQKKLLDFLNKDNPYIKGEEPGSITYVGKSDIRFLRNSCVNKLDMSYSHHKLIFLNPNYEFENMLNNFDVLLCKDANIGDACLFVEDNSKQTIFSSGMVKLNFSHEKYKYYCLAFIRDDYFRLQLDSKTPRGSTIRHAGNAFLECQIPELLDSEEWVYSIFESLIKNVAFSEKVSYEKMMETVDIIDDELMTNEVEYSSPSIKNLLNEKRVDAGMYSKSVYNLRKNIQIYKHGYSDLSGFGFDLKRGPSLQKRDLGRSIQTEEYKPNYNLLVYPSDVSDNGYIEKTTFLGARNPVWFLENKNILFSAEGTVGKTFIVCDEEMKFTTNIHGMIIYPKEKQTDLKKSVFLGLFLNYLRIKGIFDKLSVGGQGGSFAVGYWNTLYIPHFPEEIMGILEKKYHNDVNLNPFNFEMEKIQNSGVFELNNFRIKCQAVIKMLTDDIKLNQLKDINYYLQKIKKM
ncbi:hypothetical protein [Priestia aryabhattai]|uniref:hypothetical protein n=1 Tax=Priestia aryabhattai TaxID=412384 RepID=UPI002E20E89C|nr:hypothetical protein [Priestia aryabhattai]